MIIIIENKSINIYNIQTITVLQLQINVNDILLALQLVMIITVLKMLVKIIN